MEYGEFNSINTSLVEYERTTKRVPTMKSIGGAEGKKTDKKEESEPAVKIDLSKVKVEPLFEDAVDFDTFSKSDFRVVKVEACEDLTVHTGYSGTAG